MEEYIKQEIFEIEVLTRLNSAKILNILVFTGGTMMRLCHGLNRYSVDLDFWVIDKINFEKLLKKMEKDLSSDYIITDSLLKHRTLLVELKGLKYPRRLKIEIRREQKKIDIENSIAYSKFSNTQVYVRTVTLNDMMNSKIDTFIARGEIRDLFDIEFLIKKGVPIKTTMSNLQLIRDKISKLKKSDFTQKLGSILEKRDREYYIKDGFKILNAELNKLILLYS